MDIKERNWKHGTSCVIPKKGGKCDSELYIKLLSYGGISGFLVPLYEVHLCGTNFVKNIILSLLRTMEFLMGGEIC